MTIDEGAIDGGPAPTAKDIENLTQDLISKQKALADISLQLNDHNKKSEELQKEYEARFQAAGDAERLLTRSIRRYSYTQQKEEIKKRPF